MSKLIQNAIHIPEEDLYLVSTHTHDYVAHTLKDGLEIDIDGGPSYAKRCGDLYKLDEAKRYIEYCLVDDDPFEGFITERLLWGTRGKEGTQPLTFRPIKELAYRPEGAAHLQAILDNANPGPWHTRVITYWLNRLKEEKA